MATKRVLGPAATPEIRNAVRLLRTYFADDGYELFRPARQFRSHVELDFVAVPKPSRQRSNHPESFNIFLIQLTWGGKLMIRPYKRPLTNARHLLDSITNRRTLHGIVYQGRLLRYRPWKDGWLIYLQKTHQKEALAVLERSP